MKADKCKLYSNKNSTVLVMSPPNTRECPRIMLNLNSGSIRDDYNRRKIKASKRLFSKIVSV